RTTSRYSEERTQAARPRTDEGGSPMPVQPTYPGVYIEEIPSGVRTITGVATSITAFIGRASRGPVNDPVTITSFADYERNFGGLSVDSTMSYAVQDFYLNGGSEAIVVRIYGKDGTNEGVATIDLPTLGSPDGPLTLYASSPGTWGNNLLASVDYNTDDPTANPGSPPAPDPNIFNLIIYQKNEEEITKVEEYLNVSLLENDKRFLPRLLEQRSDFVNVGTKNDGSWDIPSMRPAEQLDPNNDPILTAASGGSDGLVLTETEYTGVEDDKTGLYALRKTDLFNLLCIPPPERGTDTNPAVYSQAIALCVEKRAMLIVDSPYNWASPISKAVSNPKDNLGTLLITGTNARNAALYYPLIQRTDPLRTNQLDTFVPCGAIA